MAGVTCPRCETVSAPGARVCSRCNTPLTAASRAKPGPPVAKRALPAATEAGDEDAGATLESDHDEPPASSATPPPKPKGTPAVKRAAPKAEHSSAGKDPLVGEKLQEYVIEQRIGSGGMGYVYRAVQPMIGKHVAIKVLRPDVVTDPRDIKRLLDEARVVNSIKHRGIINIFGAGSLEDGRHYLIMELLEGEPLDTLMTRMGMVPVADAVVILEQVLSALAAAHAAGIVHRDLKPANVFLVKEGPTHYVKLLDFGLARRKQEQVTRIAGTPDYISPEHARGRPAGPPADLYAFGVLCFHMLLGRLPFTGTTPIEVMEKHVHSPPPVPHELDATISKPLSELILKLLSKDPGERPDAEQVSADLRAATKQLRNASTMMSLEGLPTVKSPAVAAANDKARSKVMAREAEVADLKRKAGRTWPMIVGGLVALWLLGVAGYVMWPAKAPEVPKPVRRDPVVKAQVNPLEGPVTPKPPQSDKPDEPAVTMNGDTVAPPVVADPETDADSGTPDEADAPAENLKEVRDDVFLGEWRRRHDIDEKLTLMKASMKEDKTKRLYFSTAWQEVNASCEAATTLGGLYDCQDALSELEKHFFKTE